jgi:hypothetical protein
MVTPVPPVGFPQITSPFVDPETFHITRPWYQFLRGLWIKSGQAVGSIITGFLSPNLVIPIITIQGKDFAAVSGVYQVNETVQVTTPVEGAAPVVVAPGAVSPFTYKATFQGTLIVFGAQIEYSRNQGVTWYLASLTGGPLPVLANDWVRITWFGAAAPPVTFLPGGG